MKRNPSESTQHTNLINMMLNHFSSQGYRNIKADRSGMTSTDVIYGTKHNHVPDLTAEKNGGEFHVVVPKGSRIDAEQRAADLSIYIDTIWTPQ